MDYVAFGLLLLFVAGGGWLLGVIGFFSARNAHAEIHYLRTRLNTFAAAGPPSEHAPPAPSVVEVAEALREPEPASDEPASDEPEERREPAPDAEDLPPVAPAARRPRRDVESLLTMRLGVWIGAIALLLSGIFLIDYAAEQGLLGPAPRCIAAALLGVALIAAAEWLRRRPAAAESRSLMADQSPAALAAGGVAILFGASYAAGVMYDFIPPLVAFVFMAAAGLLGLLLALRYGQLVAAVGIVGAFLTPLLVPSDHPSALALYIYLLIASAAALAVVRYAAWTWLGWATTLFGAGWALVVILNDNGGSDGWPTALFLAAEAALALFLLPGAALETPVGRRLAWIPFAVLGTTGLVLEANVDGWAGPTAVLLLIPLAIAKGAQEPRLDRLPWLAALLAELMLLGWVLPEWHPTGEAITIEGRVAAVLPGAWAPDAILPLLWTAFGATAAFVIAGLWFERRAQHPVRWSALVAAVPVVTLATSYAKVALFQPRPLWAATALLLAAALTGAAALAMNEGAPEPMRRAGVHAAGAVAALAMMFAMLLSAQWLTLAVALFLPSLAWIEARTDLPALRKVALAVGGLVLVRLLLNWNIAGYDFGTWPILNGLLPTYGVPALAFTIAARKFRQRGDDLTVAVLEAGSAAFATVLVMLEIRHALNGGDPFSEEALEGVGALSHDFLEIALQVSAFAIMALVTRAINRRSPRRVVGAAWRIQGAIALAGAILLIAINPATRGGGVGSAPLLDALLPAYVIPALAAFWFVRTTPAGMMPRLRAVLSGYALLACFTWVTLEIHHLFQQGNLDFSETTISDAELWAWSGAWLALAAAVMAGGILTGSRALRLTAIALFALTTGKVFVVDMAGMVGLWRVLSFLGLGLTLIGLGAIYRRFVPTEAVTATTQEAP